MPTQIGAQRLRPAEPTVTVVLRAGVKFMEEANRNSRRCNSYPNRICKGPANRVHQTKTSWLKTQARTRVNAMTTTNQGLGLKLLALGAAAAAVNVPCGMWRVHTKKFSPAWFVAIHASIPAVIMLRKSMGVPKWAIALSIASAVVGQVVGARLERRRQRGLPPFKKREKDNCKGGQRADS